MKVKRLVLGPLETNCWLVDDGRGGPLLVIDPAGSSELLLAAVGELDVAHIVLTHSHFDHIGAVGALKAKTGAPISIHHEDAAFVTDPGLNGASLFGFSDSSPAPDRLLREGDVLDAGGVRLTVMETPGHTTGSICLFGDGHLFSGDTLFAGSVGRSDFPRGDGRALQRSIWEKLAPLPDEVRVHPGHGPDTTIGRERAINPFFPRA